MPPKPPRLAKKILEKLQYDDVWKTTVGDFDEYFHYMAKKEGPKKAKRWYWKQVIRYAPSKITHKFYWSAAMFFNYIKVAFRNLKKDKSYSFINISGLAIALASFFLLGLYVTSELSYDTHHKDSDQIYRIIRDVPGGMYLGTSWYAVNPMPLSIALAEDFPGISASTAVDDIEALFNIKNNPFFESGISADEDFFIVFEDLWLSGNPETAFQDPESIILTKSLADKYFGQSNPIGKPIEITIDFEEKELKTVTGIIKDVPSTSHLQYNFIIPATSRSNYDRERTFWGSNNFYSYIKIDENGSPDKLEQQITSYSDIHLKELPYYQKNPENTPIYTLQPIADVHLNSSNINFNPGEVGNKKYVYMLSLIAIIILVIGCVNYMNLATARSMNRGKEIGVRKVNGAFRSAIMMQFTAEAVLFSGLAMLVASGIIFSLAVPFASALSWSINTSILISPAFWAALIFIGLIVGLISGSYPAIYMSSLKPIGIFKNQVKGGKANRRLRNLLVIGQFAITNVLIIASIVIFKQLNYIESNDSGFDRDQILTVAITDPELMDNYEVLESTLESNSGVTEVSSARNLPSEIRSQTHGIEWDGKQEDDVFKIYHGKVNVDYIELLGIHLLAGRSFDKGLDTFTSNHFIANESMIRNIGWTPEEAIGKRLTFWDRNGEIIGVVRDFNFLSYHLDVAPLLLRYEDYAGRASLLIKVNSENLQETVALVKKQIASFSPSYPFEYSFLDDAFNNLYQTEQTLGKVFNFFTVLALFIACMGLFGLASFMMEQRAKEIGVRKVLGANVLQILTLLNKDFLKLVGLSFVIAAPIGWFLSKNWLQDFAYRIEVGPTIIITSALLAFGVSLITISFKSIKTAMANPINSLKSE